MIARILLLCISSTVLVGFSDSQPVTLRPASVAESGGVTKNLSLRPVLGAVDANTWSSGSVNTLIGDTSGQTSKNASDQPFIAIGGLTGVGFPEIRTYLPPRSRFAEPGPWAPLVAWRTVQSKQDIAQPIAHVRCMGLSPQDVAQRADLYLDMIYALSEKYALNALLVKAVIAEESCFNTGALSKVGAQGLMQLMPETATWLKVSDPHDPEQNLQAGMRYLASLHEEFDSEELALAAYNAGPGNVRRYNGVPPFAETQKYLRGVQSNYRRYKAAYNLQYPEVNPLDSARLETLAP